VGDGAEIGKLGVNARRKAGLAFVAEERLGHGAVPNLPLSTNMVLTRHASDAAIARRGLVNRAGAAQAKERIVQTYDVRKGKPDPEARSLSGGNLQKFVMGRELDRKPGILVVNQPTWGVDAGAASAIRQALIDLARGGAAVLVISQDLDEIFEIADRIAVMSRGQLSDARDAQSLNRETIGLLMAGAHEVDHAA
jgi:general nucleoside transport system ATP-binding protein